jgi:hypothetical protein
MSEEWKRYHPKLALFDVLTKGGGVTIERALQRAETAVEHHRGKANTLLEDEVLRLEAIVSGKSAADQERIYKIASDIISVANMFQAPLCHAANSLCELSSRMRAAGRWDWPAVAVHVGAMRALLGKRDVKDAQVVSVLNGLMAVVARYPDASASEAASA